MEAIAQRHYMSGEEFDRLVASDLITEDTPVELIEGELLPVSPQGPAHSSMTEVFRELVLDAVGPGWHCVSHSSVDTTADSRVEPDLTLVRGRPIEYFSELPGQPNVGLVVEIVSSRQTFPRAQSKIDIYARGGIPEYWIVRLKKRLIDVYSDLADDEYRSHQEFGIGDRVDIPQSDSDFAVADLLGGIPDSAIG